MSHRTLSVLAENTPRALAQVVSLFAGRGYAFGSLTVGATDDPAVSRITLVVAAADDQALEQITKQLNKLVVVHKVVDLAQESTIQRELVLAKVQADGTTRSQIVAIAELFRARTVDVSPDSVTIEATGSSDKLEALLKMLEPFGLRDLAQSGAVALTRGSRTTPVRTATERTTRTLHALARAA